MARRARARRDGAGLAGGGVGRRRVRGAVRSGPARGAAAGRAGRLRLPGLDRRDDPGSFPDLVRRAGAGASPGAWRPGRARPCRWPDSRRPRRHTPVGAAGGRTVDQREGPRLSVPGRAFPGPGHHPVGAAVLRGACLRGVVRRCQALARPLRRRGGRRPVLLVRRCAVVRLAGLHADVHRRLPDRRGLRGAAVGGACRRSQLMAAHLGGTGRVRNARGRDVYPLHRHRCSRLRCGGCARGVLA